MLDFCITKLYLGECRVKKKKRMGRPLKTGKPLTKIVPVRMSDAEHRKLVAKAKAAGLSVSEFIRQQAKD